MPFFALFSEKSLGEELWEYFVDKYFSPDVPYLENFTLGSGTMISLRLIIIGLSIGIIIASFGTLYTKRYIGDFVRKMIREECLDAARAKTLAELGYLKSPGVRGVIKTRGSLSRWVRCVEEDKYNKDLQKKREEFEEAHKGDAKKPKFKEVEFVRDLNTMHFYIPEEKKYAAEVRFDAEGAHIGGVILVSIGAVALCVFLCYILPDMLKFVDNFISVMK